MQWGTEHGIVINFTSKENYELCLSALKKLERIKEWATLFMVLITPFVMPFWLSRYIDE